MMKRFTGGVISVLLILTLAPPAWAQFTLMPLACNEAVQGAAEAGPFVISGTEYVLDVPEGATRLTVTLHSLPRGSGPDLDLFIGFGQPVDQASLTQTATWSSISSGDEELTLTSASQPPLRAGTYYIAIGNTDASPARFELTATLEPCSASLSPEEQAIARQAITLPPNQAQTGPLKAVGAGGAQRAFSERQYKVEVPKGTQALAIGLESLAPAVGPQSARGGNIDLHVRAGRPVGTGDQVIADFSLVSPTGFEFILLTQKELKPGTYFISVENREGSAQQFQLAALTLPLLAGPINSDSSDDGRVDPTDKTGLLALMRQFLQTRQGALALTQYVLDVPERAKRLTISVEGAGGLNVHLRFGAPVAVSEGQAVADLSVTGPSEAKALKLSGQLLQPGRYYVAIEGLSGARQDFTIRFAFEVDGRQSVTILHSGYLKNEGAKELPQSLISDT